MTVSRDAGSRNPVWSPDGSRIAFISEPTRNEDSEIFLMDADGSNVTQLTKGEDRYAFDINGFTPWSPDGSKLVFFHILPGEQGTTLQVMDIADQNIITLTNEPGQYLLPSWSPDGTQIAWYRYGRGDRAMDLIGKVRCLDPEDSPRELVIFLSGDKNSYEPIPIKKPNNHTMRLTMTFDIPELRGPHVDVVIRVRDGAAASGARRRTGGAGRPTRRPAGRPTPGAGG